MAQRLKAIPTTYHGIEFRSKLEAKYAQAFDRLGIVWEYEGHGFRFDDGTCYCPDFYMPELDTYFEVKGFVDDDSKRKIQLLAMECKRVAIGLADGDVGLLVGYPPGSMENDDGPNFYVDNAIPTRCNSCGKVYFREEEMSWTCPACGRSGDDFTTIAENLFEAVGWERGR